MRKEAAHAASSASNLRKSLELRTRVTARSDDDHRDNGGLLDFVGAVSGETYLKVEENLGEGFVRLRVSEAERRQATHDIRSFEDVVIELLRNARDARANLLFIATSRDGDNRLLTMIDDGVGIPQALHDAVFEPRVTSKLESMVMDRWGVHGRGMALYSVRSNVSSARIAVSDSHKGAAISVCTDTSALPERADQSAWPALERDDTGRMFVARGPHNIIRRVLEFVCEHPELDVYYGSPAEVVATLRSIASRDLDASQLLFCDDVESLPVWQRPATASDARDLVALANHMALPISERTAHRILAGELGPLDTVMSQAVHEEEDDPVPPRPDIYRDRRGLKIHHTDLARFKHDCARAFDDLAERYYVHLKGEPKVSVTRDGLRVRFDVEKDE